MIKYIISLGIAFMSGAAAAAIGFIAAPSPSATPTPQVATTKQAPAPSMPDLFGGAGDGQGAPSGQNGPGGGFFG